MTFWTTWLANTDFGERMIAARSGSLVCTPIAVGRRPGSWQDLIQVIVLLLITLGSWLAPAALNQAQGIGAYAYNAIATIPPTSAATSYVDYEHASSTVSANRHGVDATFAASRHVPAAGLVAAEETTIAARSVNFKERSRILVNDPAARLGLYQLVSVASPFDTVECRRIDSVGKEARETENLPFQGAHFICEVRYPDVPPQAIRELIVEL